ncbi:MAG: chloride channel protein [Rhodospirillaceae bacterium]|nr:chloride channel protein [Rhodospirillaceae bacterium]
MNTFFHLPHGTGRLARFKNAYPWRIVEHWPQRLSVWLGGITIALCAIAFAMATEKAFSLFEKIVAWHPAMAFVIAPIGLVLVAGLTLHFVPGAQGSGIPQTIAALNMTSTQRKGVLSLRIAFAKVLLTSIGLASGASVGREGPSVQVGASLMLRMAKLFRLKGPLNERSMTLAGGAAGIAAAFNTPLAGVVFAIEELSRSYEARTSGTVLTAVILAGITSLALVGNSPYFGHTDVLLDLGRGWFAVGLIGLAGGVLGGLFSQFLVVASQHGLPGPIGRLARQRPIAFAAACGLSIAIIGVASGHTTYGTGYQEARALLEGETMPWTFFPLKILATLFSYLSGIPGGLFSPSLSAGAGLGATMARLLPDTPGQACILLGMAAYFTGVVQSPITAAVIVMEMTDNRELTVPLLATSFMAFGASRLVCPHPLYKALAIRFLAHKSGGSKKPVRTDLSDELESSPPLQPDK